MLPVFPPIANKAPPTPPATRSLRAVGIAALLVQKFPWTVTTTVAAAVEPAAFVTVRV